MRSMVWTATKRWHLVPHLATNSLSKRELSSSTYAAATSSLLSQLAQLDTASLCDADKSLLSSSESLPNYTPLQILQGFQPINPQAPILVGTAYTVQCTVPNDFLAVLEGLTKAPKHSVLVVQTLQSTKAVAGELFAAAATQQGLAGIIVDGPMRDTQAIMNASKKKNDEDEDDTDNESFIRCYATSITPYSGTTQHVGKYNVPIDCGGVTVSPGDILVGDNDGILVAPWATFERILDTAQNIQAAEATILQKMTKDGQSLHSLTNFQEHVQAIREGRQSNLQFKV